MHSIFEGFVYQAFHRQTEGPRTPAENEIVILDSPLQKDRYKMLVNCLILCPKMLNSDQNIPNMCDSIDFRFITTTKSNVIGIFQSDARPGGDKIIFVKSS